LPPSLRRTRRRRYLALVRTTPTMLLFALLSACDGPPSLCEEGCLADAGDAGGERDGGDRGDDAGRDAGRELDGGDDAGRDAGTDAGPPPLTVLDVDVSHEHACAVLSDHSVWCWGEGAAVTESGANLALTPTEYVVPGAIDVAAGSGLSCAMTASEMWCWGSNSFGRLGPDADAEYEPTPLLVPFESPPTGAANVQIEAGTREACVRRDDGSVWCWGTHENVEHESAILVASGARDVDIGPLFGCVATAEGATCWPSGAIRMAPVEDGEVTADATRIGGGSTHACALSGSAVWCWGGNERSQAVPTSSELVIGEAAVALADPAVVDVAVGAITCAARAGADVVCWGTATFEFDYPEPTSIAGTSDVAGLAVGGAACVITSDRRDVLCWGNGENGRLGDGSTESRAAPVRVLLPTP
jgi:alpha-tubulin suppressor-like RCC1 family protein